MVLAGQQQAIAEILEALCRASGLRAVSAQGGVRLESQGGSGHVFDVSWVPRMDEVVAWELARSLPKGARPRLLLADVVETGALRSAPALGLHVASPSSAHIDLPGLFVHIEGPSTDHRPQPQPSARAERARVLFALLRHDGESSIDAARLASEAGLSVHAFQLHLLALADRGQVLLEGQTLRLADRGAMQRAWELGYGELRPQLVWTEAAFVGFPSFRSWQEWLLAQPRHGSLLGGALGAALLGCDVIPDTATIHVAGLTPQLLRSCRVLPLPGGPITLLRPVGVADAHPANPQLVDPWLVVAELSQSADPRVRTLRDSLRSQLAPPPGDTDPLELLA
jgi:hypothetical protein